MASRRSLRKLVSICWRSVLDEPAGRRLMTEFEPLIGEWLGDAGEEWEIDFPINYVRKEAPRP